MLPVYSLQRTRAIASPYHDTAPVWIDSATPLERLFLARHASQKLEEIAPLNALESLIASKNARTSERKDALQKRVQQEYPAFTTEHLNSIVQDGWSLGKDTKWKTMGLQEQQLLLRFAAVYKNILRPLRTGQYSVLDVDDVIKSAPAALHHDPVMQQIVSANNPRLLTYWTQTKQPVDEVALAMGLFDHQRAQRNDYNQLSDHTFACLIAHEPSLGGHWDLLKGIQEGNKSLFFYPWNKVHLLLEHNPARFIHSVLANHDVANGLHLVKKWFSPMLQAAAIRSTQDPSYAAFMASVIFSLDAKKRLKATLERYDPEALVCLQTLRELHSDGPRGPDNAVFGWLNWLAHRENLALRLDLPDLGADVGEPSTP